jgi:hypothetical protein
MTRRHDNASRIGICSPEAEDTRRAAARATRRSRRAASSIRAALAAARVDDE